MRHPILHRILGDRVALGDLRNCEVRIVRGGLHFAEIGAQADVSDALQIVAVLVEWIGEPVGQIEPIDPVVDVPRRLIDHLAVW